MSDSLLFTITATTTAGVVTNRFTRPATQTRGVIHDVFEAFTGLDDVVVQVHATRAPDGQPASGADAEWLLVATFIEPPFEDTPGLFTPAGDILWRAAGQLGNHDERHLILDVFDGVHATADPEHTVGPDRGLPLPV